MLKGTSALNRITYNWHNSTCWVFKETTVTCIFHPLQRTAEEPFLIQKFSAIPSDSNKWNTLWQCKHFHHLYENKPVGDPRSLLPYFIKKLPYWIRDIAGKLSSPVRPSDYSSLLVVQASSNTVTNKRRRALKSDFRVPGQSIEGYRAQVVIASTLLVPRNNIDRNR